MQILKFAKDESMGVLYIPEIPQYGVLVENPEEIQNSMFCDIYAGAIDNVYDIIQSQGSTKNELFFNYRVINKTPDNNMLFGIGGHPGFKCDYSKER